MSECSSDEDFPSYCRSLIKVSERNRIIKERLQPEITAHQSVSHENFEMLVRRQVDNEKKRRSLLPGPSLLEPIERKYGIAMNSCFMWYVLKGKSARNVIPDYELTYCREVFKKMLRGSPNAETHFGLGKLLFHDENNQESLYHFTEALKYSNDMLYKQWHTFMVLHFSCHNHEQAQFIFQHLNSKFLFRLLEIPTNFRSLLGITQVVFRRTIENSI